MFAKIDLADAPWTLAGWTPNLWRFATSMETNAEQQPEIPAFPVRLPVSVQGALLGRKILPDPYTGFNARLCEWVENRHWIFQCETHFPQIVSGHRYQLVLPGVDAAGWVRFDGKVVGAFDSAHRPHPIELGTLEPGRHRVEIVFDSPVRFAGQFGRTESMSVTKPRFYYTWDWIPRMVQIGVTQSPYLLDCDAPQMRVTELWSDADAAKRHGRLRLQGRLSGTEAVTVTLGRNRKTLLRQRLSAEEFQRGVLWQELPVELWEPNLSGEARLYDLQIDGGAAGTIARKIGFKEIRWQPCTDAPPDADPWVCVINGVPTFLQGFNWTPIRPFFADLTEADYRSRLNSYRQMGCNVLRIWGGASLEPEFFYHLCDELGLLVWQEFPLSSSGLNNTPPADEASLREMALVADHYLQCLSGHVSLLAWSGGNELQRGPDGGLEGCGIPCDLTEPMIALLHARTTRRDPTRRFMATSASGPREFAETDLYGQGLLWEVHGPWRWDAPLKEGWFAHWDGDDSLFRAEFGCPGASGAELIRKYAGEEACYPCSPETPLWRYPLDWWAEEEVFQMEFGRAPESLEEYVDWNQARQAEALTYAVGKMKSRFPRCGGAILWMGHDSFPCTANTSVIDFEGGWKPAAHALSALFHTAPGALQKERANG